MKKHNNNINMLYKYNYNKLKKQLYYIPYLIITICITNLWIILHLYQLSNMFLGACWCGGLYHNILSDDTQGQKAYKVMRKRI
jgi:hypothetical protein